MDWLQLRFDFDCTWIRLRFDDRSTAAQLLVIRHRVTVTLHISVRWPASQQLRWPIYLFSPQCSSSSHTGRSINSRLTIDYDYSTTTSEYEHVNLIMLLMMMMMMMMMMIIIIIIITSCARPSASCAAEQIQRSNTFPRRIRSHADRCSRLTR